MFRKIFFGLNIFLFFGLINLLFAFQNKYHLSEIMSNCDKDVKVKFYKSMLFVNGYLASADMKDVNNCIDLNKKSFLSFKKSDIGEYEGYACECGESKQLGCHKKEDWICNTVTCWGGCEKDKKYSYEDKYIYGEEIFKKIPESLSIEFLDNIVIDNGKVYSVGLNKEVLKYLDSMELDKIISTLTGYDILLAGKIKNIKNSISDYYANKENNDKKKIILKEYDMLFDGGKPDFKKYDTYILENLWEISETLCDIKGKDKCLSDMEYLYKVLSMREDTLKTKDYYKDIFYKIKK
ncbi:MAG TPA: hypothetical protein PLN68_02035 [Elusimicrobiales bacterium]|nr:hypothetical protein [Elusimicrobiales bacterium]